MNSYDFENVVATKILIEKNDRFFLIQEPATNDWRPNCWGLPGGKMLLGEPISKVINRKIQTEVGFEVRVEGLIKIIDILMPEKNVYHLIFSARYLEGRIDLKRIEGQNAKWFTADSICKMSKDEFAEYYIDEILQDYLKKKKTAPMEIIKEQDNNQLEIKEWMDKDTS